jgi:hypothetical protein
MGKIEKTFWWLCFILAIYTTIGFKLIPVVLKDQLIKNLDANLTAKSSIEKVEFNPYSLTARLYNYKLANEETIASFDKLTLDLGLIASISDLHANIQEVKLEKLYLNIIEEKDGSFNVAKLVKPTQEVQEEPKDESSSQIEFLVSKIFLENSKIDFTKLKDKEPYKISINDINYKLRDVGTFNNSLSSNDLKLKINEFTNLSVEGAFRLIPFKMYGKANIEDLRVKELLNYDMSSFNFNLNKEANINLGMDFNIDTTKKTDVVLNSTIFNINNLNVIQNELNTVSLKKLDIKNFKFDLDKQEILVDTPTVNTLNVKVLNSKDGINLANLVKSQPTKDEEPIKETKPWIVKVSNSILENINTNYTDKINSLVINSKNTIKINRFNLDGSNIDLSNINLKASNFNFEDNKNRLTILDELISINMDKLDLKNNKIAINSIKLNSDNLNVKDKSSIKLSSAKNSINVSKINIDGSNIDINSVNTTLANLNFDELKSKLNIKSKQTKIDASNLKINGSKINISKISLGTPNLDLKDRINNMTIGVKSTNVDLNSLILNGSNIDIKTIKLSRPDINFYDKKNNISLKAQDLQVYVNKLSQKGSRLNINSLRVVQPKVNFLNTKDKTNILANNIDLSVSGIYNSNSLLKVNKTTVNRPIISVILPKSNSTKDEVKNEVEKKTTKENSNGKKIDIGPITIRNAKLNFEDKNLPIPFKTTVSKLNGSISEFKSDIQSKTKLQVRGVVDEYGTTNITGVVNPNSIKLLTDINMVFKNIAMKNFTPYTGKFIGRELKSGKLDLDLNYNIQSSNLKAQNNVVIKQLELGNKVESKDAVSLPLELAIALLQDTSGVIDLNLPISGNVDDPQFSIAPIVFKAFVNLITKALTAPFSLLGAIFGFDANEINSVDFNYGESEITPIQRETLDKINKILTKRPNLVLEIIPSYENQKDLLALKNNKFIKIVNNELPNKNIKNYDEKYLELLEEIYKDYDKKVKELKNTHTTDNKINIKTYKKALESFIINKQDVKTEELEKIAKIRAINIKEYLVKQKGISVKQVKVSKALKQKDSTSKTLNIDLEIKKL